MSAILSAWAVTYLVHSTILIGLVWLAARWIASASCRDTLWKVALCGGILTATLQTALPSAVPTPVTFDRGDLDRIAPAAVWANAEARVEFESGSTAPAIPWDEVAFAAWGAVALVLLARLAIGHARFLSAIGPRTEILVGPERDRLDRACASASVRRAVRLTRSARLASPVAMLGWEIVVPEQGFERLSGEQRETILAHELTHLVRRDPAWLTAGEAIKALLFFQPLSWLVQAKAKETAEFLCDDAAVLHTGHPKALALTLAELAAHVPAPPAVAAMAEGGSNLMARVQRVLQSTPVAPLGFRVRLSIALAVLAVLGFLAPRMVAETVRASSDEHENYVSDATLSQTFEGPEGQTKVLLRAHEARIAPDGSTVTLVKRDGYLWASQTSARGPKREVEVVRGSGGAPQYRYKVDGVETKWCEDAGRVIVAAFGPSQAYPDAGPFVNEVLVQPPRRTVEPDSARDWDANVELTGSTDGVPTYLSIRASGIRFHGAEIQMKRGARLDVVERHGSLERSFHMDESSKSYAGAFESAEKEPWLAGILREQTTLPEATIEAIVR